MEERIIEPVHDAAIQFCLPAFHDKLDFLAVILCYIPDNPRQAVEDVI
ncbi:MAG: hypothetical protein A4E42_01367 [Methanoregulaceae archaeon PtaU1.Bin222]|nr:MAG: hypothetical protein A4E42_01367 [Methanoregulaceae archaeon PtaU1.Bin222]